MLFYIHEKIDVFLPLFFLGSFLDGSISTPYHSKIEAVIFDCDGVLVDTEYLKFLAWKEALSSKNIDFTVEEYMPLVGHSSNNILLMLKKQKQIDISEDVIQIKNEKYQVLQEQGVPPIHAMVSFARQLADRKKNLGIQLGLASSASLAEIRQNLKQIDLKDAFDLVISGSDDLDDYLDPEGKNKPKPYIYIEAAKRLGTSPKQCLVFEDTQAGIEAAAGAGMIAIAVPNEFTYLQDFSQAAQVLLSYEELPVLENLLLQLNE